MKRSDELLLKYWWWLLGGLLLAVTLIVSLLPISATAAIPWQDKLQHLLTFFLLMLWFGLLSGHRLRVAVALLLFGALVEGLQWLTPYRLAEWLDWLADGAGIALAWGLLRIRPVAGGLARLLAGVDRALARVLPERLQTPLS